MPFLGPNISAHRFFPDMRFVAVNSKYSLVSHTFELGIFNDADKRESKMYHSGLVGCLPAPNIFHLANEFAKGKMFWNLGILGENFLRSFKRLNGAILRTGIFWRSPGWFPPWICLQNNTTVPLFWILVYWTFFYPDVLLWTCFRVPVPLQFWVV